MKTEAKQEFQKVLGEVNVREVMSSEVLCVYEGWSIKRLADFFVKHNISGAPVIASDHSIVGVVTQSDVVRFDSKSLSESELRNLAFMYFGNNTAELSADDLSHLRDKASENCTVNLIMTEDVISIEADSNLSEACQLLEQKGLHRLFVVEEEKIVGVVTANDILREFYS